MSRQEELPFGHIKEENLAESPNNPLYYAEANFDGGHLMWYGSSDSFNEKGFELRYVLDYDNFSKEEFTRKVRLGRESAKNILKEKDMEWDYAE